MPALQSALLVNRFLANCAFGRVLVLDGSGGRGLSAQLRLAGADAIEIATSDVSSGAAGAQIIIKRIRELGASSVTSVLCVDLLDRLDMNSISEIFGVLREVAQRHLMVCLNNAAITIPPREWWDGLAISQGWRRHARLMSVVPYHELEFNEAPRILMFERLRDEALNAFPLSSLKDERDLHMDMGREPGRRSDAHVARYHYATQLIRHGDVVLDAACGLGYGSQLLWASGLPSKVLGFDISESAIGYCSANFGLPDGSVYFRAVDLGAGIPLPDDSVDLIASFETLEHLHDPEAFLAEAFRVLKPSGRLTVSVPNLWCDEDGNDPNPHHFHVYDREKLLAQMRKHFFVEQVSSQIAGGGMVLTDHPRSWTDLPPHQEIALPNAEWWIVTGMKVDRTATARDEDRSSGQMLVEQGFPTEKPVPASVDFSGYERPWLIRSLVSTGWRIRDREALRAYARIIEFESLEGSEEQGAALCVQGYRLLERLMQDGSGSDQALEAMLSEFVLQPPSERLHIERWRVSISYLLARICIARHDFATARRWYRECVGGVAIAKMPTLGTKLVDAYLQLGLLAVGVDQGEARQYWIAGQDHAIAILRGDWRELVGSTAGPFFFGYDEALEILSLARDCSNCLLGLEHPQRREGFDFGLPNQQKPSPVYRALLASTQGHQEALRLFDQVERMRSREAELLARIAHLEAKGPT